MISESTLIRNTKIFVENGLLEYRTPRKYKLLSAENAMRKGNQNNTDDI